MGLVHDLGTLIVGPPQADTVQEAVPWVCLLAFLYNLDHGIIPAALPQVEAKYGPNPMAEALLQVVSVLGILTGIAFGHAAKLDMSRVNLIVSTLLVAVCCFGTWLVPFDKDLSYWLHFTRFVTGVAASYAIVMVPRWLDVRLLRVDRESATATYLSYGIFGTVVGYILVLTIPAIKMFLIWCAAATEDWREDLRSEPQWERHVARAEEWAVKVFGCEDFRQAFLYAGIISIITLLRFVNNVPPLLIRETDQAPPFAVMTADRHSDASGHAVRPLSLPSVEMVTYHPLALEMEGRSDPGHFLESPGGLDTQWVSDLCEFTVFRWTILAIGTLMTIANAVSFWLFTHFRQGHQCTDQTAILCTAIVLVGGSALGMNFPPRRILRDEPTSEPGGLQLNAPLFRGFTLCTGMASLCGTTVCLVKDTTTTTVLFAMAIYFGASVLPLAQTTFGYSVKPDLKANAMTLYQFVYQATWIVGPLLPVLMGRIMGGSAPELGLRCTCLLNWLAFVCFWRATRFQEQRETDVHTKQYPATASAIL